jgi:hypothetical protein
MICESFIPPKMERVWYLACHGGPFPVDITLKIGLGMLGKVHCEFLAQLIA